MATEGSWEAVVPWEPDNVLTSLCWPEPGGGQVATWSSQFLILQPAATRASPGQSKPRSPFPHITSLQMYHGPGCTLSHDSAGEQASAGRRSWGNFNSRCSRVQAQNRNQWWGKSGLQPPPWGLSLLLPLEIGLQLGTAKAATRCLFCRWAWILPKRETSVPAEVSSVTWPLWGYAKGASTGKNS